MSVLSNTGIRAGASAAGGGGTKYVEEVFSTYVYEGNGSTLSIVNNIDLSGEGGMVWLARRTGGYYHAMTDTERGAGKYIYSNGEGDMEDYSSNSFTSFNDDGFTLGSYSNYNGSTNKQVAWSFRKQPGFFDVVTYTGDGVDGRNIAHNLGSVPGCIFVKKTDGADQYWAVYHVGTGATHYMKLNDPMGASDNEYFWDDTTPTATHFRVGDTTSVNNDGSSYVAYLFAAGSDADSQIFGDDEDESIIKCGSFSYTGGTPLNVDLGWEAQYVLVKRYDGSEAWYCVDNMRGMIDGNIDGGYLQMNYFNDEGTNGVAGAKPTGFVFDPGTNLFGTSDWIYIAIRRGPMKAPEDATEVFTIDAGGNTTNPLFTAPYPADCLIYKIPDSASDWGISSRLTGTGILKTNTDDSESDGLSATWDHMGGAWNGWSGSSSDYNGWMFRRASGFFDIVCYDGNSTNRTINHSLGVAPELMFVKSRSGSGGSYEWAVYSKTISENHYMYLNTDESAAYGDQYWNQTVPTASVFSLGIDDNVNDTGKTYIAYLFASLDGISKVGTYTGTGSSHNIDCGFTGGARFVLIKRTNASGDWRVFDTARGIAVGNDSMLRLNENNEENTTADYVDPLSSGFTVTSAWADTNASGGTYIYLAIA